MVEMTVELVLYVGAVGLIVIGIAGLVLSSHGLRMILALAIAETGANLLLVLAGYRQGAAAPILTSAQTSVAMVDPVPQAMVLTAIVIGVGVQALAVAVLIRAYRAYGTLDLRELRRRMELDVAAATGVAPPSSQDAPAGERSLVAPAVEKGA